MSRQCLSRLWSTPSSIKTDNLDVHTRTVTARGKPWSRLTYPFAYLGPSCRRIAASFTSAFFLANKLVGLRNSDSCSRLSKTKILFSFILLGDANHYLRSIRCYDHHKIKEQRSWFQQTTKSWVDRSVVLKIVFQLLDSLTINVRKYDDGSLCLMQWSHDNVITTSRLPLPLIS